MDTENEAKKVIESSKSGEVIKTLSDLRMDKYEARLDALEKTNADLISANKEMYAFIAANYSKPSTDLHPSSVPSQPVTSTMTADGVTPTIGMVQTEAPKDEPSVDNVMAKLGYPKQSPDGQ